MHNDIINKDEERDTDVNADNNGLPEHYKQLAHGWGVSPYLRDGVYYIVVPSDADYDGKRLQVISVNRRLAQGEIDSVLEMGYDYLEIIDMQSPCGNVYLSYQFQDALPKAGE